MDFFKWVRLHPTDDELIEYLHFKTFDRDSLVQIIDELQDICESEPWELAGRSTLQTGNRLWYFLYPPKYKYPNSKLISRTTRDGYWKPTGNARIITNPDTGEEIGSKKTLVFYKGQYNDKNKIKTSWVMHEYELKATPKANDSDHKTLRLCRLKKKPDISSIKAGQSNQHSLSNLDNHVANNAMSENLLDPSGSTEPEAPSQPDGVHNHCSSVEKYAGNTSNQNNVANEDENLYSSTIEQDDESCNSVLTNSDETFSVDKSNQHNTVVAAEGFELPSILECLADEDLIPKELLYSHGLSLDELLAEPEATNNSTWIQKQFVTNAECGEFLNSSFGNNNEACLQGGNTQQQCLAADADDDGFCLPLTGVTTESLYIYGLSHNELLAGPEATNNSTWIQKQFVTNTECGEFLNSSFGNNNEACLQEGNTQQQCLAADANDEGFCLPLTGVTMESLYSYGLSHDELLAEPEATNNSTWIQKQFVTNTECGEFLNSSFGNNNEACLQEGNTQQQRLAADADDEGFRLPLRGVTMESFDSVEKSRKRPRLQYDGLSHHVEYPSRSNSIQPDSYNRMVTPQNQIGGRVTYQ